MILLNDYMQPDKRIYVDSDIRIGDEYYKIYGDKDSGKTYYVVYNKSIIGTFRPQCEYHPALSDLYKFLDIKIDSKHCLKLGDILSCDDTYYMITTPAPDRISLICISDTMYGMRWDTEFVVNNVSYISYEEIYKHLGSSIDEFSYVGYMPDILKVKE